MIGRKKISIGLMSICFLVLILVTMFQNVKAAVTLVSFDAFHGDQQVVLEWETASEANMLGFYITRNDQQNGDYTRLDDFIFTQGTSVSGMLYQYIDSNLKNGKAYYYKLEAVDNNYDSEYFGPVYAIPMQNSATETHTVTNTSVTELDTRTIAPTISPTKTLKATLDQTQMLTPSLTPTSRFSFNTNTPTVTSTETARISSTITATETPDLSLTLQFTRTYKIISYNTFTPTMTPLPEETSPFKQGLVGFVVTLIVGLLLMTLLIIFQRKRGPV